jgi:hypothetical protein
MDLSTRARDDDCCGVAYPNRTVSGKVVEIGHRMGARTFALTIRPSASIRRLWRSSSWMFGSGLL